MKQNQLPSDDPFNAYFRLLKYRKGLRGLLQEPENQLRRRFKFIEEIKRVNAFLYKLESIIKINVKGDFKNSLLFTNFEFYQDAGVFANLLINPEQPEEPIEEKKRNWEHNWLLVINNKDRHKRIKQYQKEYRVKRMAEITADPKRHEKFKAERRAYMKKYNLKKRLINPNY